MKSLDRWSYENKSSTPQIIPRIFSSSIFCFYRCFKLEWSAKEAIYNTSEQLCCFFLWKWCLILASI